MEFTGKLAKEVSTIAIDTLNKVFAEKGYDITVSNGGGNYAPLQFNMKLTLSVDSADGDSQAQADYKLYADLYQLPLEMLGATFNYNGKFFTVMGLLPNRRKNDIQIENAKGKTFIAPHESVVRAYKLHIAKTQFAGTPIPEVAV
tara:strand:+ start:2454 stop:2888 length:435 start_codon:yes stop_codon:yes gene_type:complete